MDQEFEHDNQPRSGRRRRRLWILLAVFALLIGILIGGVKLYYVSYWAGWHTRVYAYALNDFILDHGRLPESITELEVAFRKKGLWQIPMEGQEPPYYRIPAADASGPQIVLVQPAGRWYHLSTDVFRIMPDGKTLAFERDWFADPEDYLDD